VLEDPVVILVVEDDYLMQSMVEDALIDAGFELARPIRRRSGDPSKGK
jgi:hypothetical protein